MSTILCIPDTHLPYVHKLWLDHLKRLADTYQPDSIKHLGDLFDLHRWGRWIAEPDSPGQVEEMEKALKLKEELAKLFPNMTIMSGNHDLRFEKQAKNAGLGSRFVRTYHEVFELPKGWKIVDGEVVKGEPCGKIYFFHGDGFTGKYAPLQAAETHRMNIVMGHVHANAGVMYSANINDVIWGFNVGCLVDIHSFGMAYGKHFARKPVLGAGVIVDGTPTFEPLRDGDFK